ncbi:MULTISPECIES: alpha/beta hydrolase fold domain-containing protein [unclassified Curtobacterium]|uniref:alpha/beta hydrolase fold domain-containing protein n=1 Tax=unclassified Curtobacterium TaxID=257496 RepID=UPI0008DCAAF6|nr:MULTISPECIES: alpha/beta hydrolase [unclassified Curtobacterium]OIH95048.1 hypothetical protein BIU92_06765 [Curtobacterium sp. MCBA15_003]OII32209.1 hypothetical protein BIU94_02310 [Curtobacterium sp. MMLR14_006]
MYLPEALAPSYLRATRANRPYRTVEGAAREVRRHGRHPEPAVPPERLRLRPDVAVTVRREHGRPVYTVRPTRSTPVGETVYVHGGGWVHDISRQHWALVAQVAAESNTTVTVPLYALLPHGDAAAAVALVVHLFEAATASGHEVRLAGDSAGGQVALSAALALRDRGHRAVRTVLLAPALDLTMANPRVADVLPSDPWLGVDGLRHLGAQWAGRLPVTNPAVSPLAGDPTGLGPVLLLTGTRDVLNPDAHLLAAGARAAGVDVELVERRGAVHVFPLLPTRPAAAARDRIVAALRA